MSSPLTPADDDFHEPPTGEWWFHETCWFSFFVPELALGSWVYAWARPTIGVTGGGCWIWDDTAVEPWAVPHCANHHNLRLPSPRDLRDIDFPTGMSVTMLEPLRAYRIRYSDRAGVELDLEFRAVMDPWVRTGADGAPNHFDQFGRVTGTVDLHGRSVTVDCLAIRDRTWTVRSERWKVGGGYGYVTGAASESLLFHTIATDDSATGFFVEDGRTGALVGGRRIVERDPASGTATRVVIEASDEHGRTLHADGTPVSQMAMPVPGVNGICWTSLIRWSVNGHEAWGEDQEPWPVSAWSQRRRAGVG